LGVPTAYVAAFTIILASAVALSKDDLKARLAYSTVSQLSYIVLGVAMLSPMAVTGGLAHIAHHAFSKITLFFAAGAIYVATHLKKISLLSGLGRRMPWTFGAFALASLSMIGVPPVCGFVSKWYLANGVLQAHHAILLLALLASTALNLAYFGPIVYKAFFEEPAPGINIEEYREAPGCMVIPLFLTAVISVLLGLYTKPVLSLISALRGF
jgi:multicomponent Na+:H+ antiporter subunit D